MSRGNLPFAESGGRRRRTASPSPQACWQPWSPRWRQQSHRLRSRSQTLPGPAEKLKNLLRKYTWNKTALGLWAIQRIAEWLLSAFFHLYSLQVSLWPTHSPSLHTQCSSFTTFVDKPVSSYSSPKPLIESSSCVAKITDNTYKPAFLCRSLWWPKSCKC